jgi:hypothetical protein
VAFDEFVQMARSNWAAQSSRSNPVKTKRDAYADSHANGQEWLDEDGVEE